MIKLIIPDILPNPLDLAPYNQRIQEICLQLEAEHPGWLRLDEDALPDLLNDTAGYSGRTFVIPEVLVQSRRHMTKVNRLVAYLFSIARKLNWDFVIIGSSLKAIDSRIRGIVDEVESWGNNGEH